MLESVREIHEHVNKQLTNHSSGHNKILPKNRDGFYLAI